MSAKQKTKRGASEPPKEDSKRKKWNGEPYTEFNLQSIPLASRQIKYEKEVKLDVKVCTVQAGGGPVLNYLSTIMEIVLLSQSPRGHGGLPVTTLYQPEREHSLANLDVTYQ